MKIDPVLADLNRYMRDEDKAAAFDAAVSQREAEIWQDDEILSEFATSLDCLEVRGRRSGSYAMGKVTRTYNHPPVTTGKPAMAAIRDGDAIELLRLMRAELAEKVRQRAIDDVEERYDH